MEYNFNLSKLRCRNMAWMSETGDRAIWRWSQVFMKWQTLCPKFARVRVFGWVEAGNTAAHRLFKGSNDEANGPPSEANS